MHIIPFPISRRSGSRKSYGSHRRSGSRKSHRNLKSSFPQSLASFVRYDVDEGYDVDKVVRPFYPVPLSHFTDSKIMGERICKIMREKINAMVDFVIKRINARLKRLRLGVRYKPDKLVKVVEHRPCRTTLVTFTVNEVSHNPSVIRTVRAMVFNPTSYNYKLKKWRFNFKLDEWSFKP